MTKTNSPVSDLILDSLSEGLYACDRERRIIYWSKVAERITGWSAEDVVGHCCHDNILNHVDKDGHLLCGEEFCPLHRSMVTGRASTTPVILFGLKKAGGRVPLEVSVAPLCDTTGNVIGGVETFRDFSNTFVKLEQAKRIQTLSMEQELSPDPRLSIATFYLPHDIIGGDYFGIRQLDKDNYGFILADVMGHGVAAALHTIHLDSLWNRYLATLSQPAKFARLLNRDLCKIVKDESFATAICGILNASKRVIRVVSAGAPGLLQVRRTGQTKELVAPPSLPFGVMSGVDYEECEFTCSSGDSLLIFTDGALEIHDAAGHMLGTEGLAEILLDKLDYPHSRIRMESLHEALLKFSNNIRLPDDLTLLEVRLT
ncbi:MAG: PAS domain S-box protein [Candidatus Electrothrix sp. AR4]|nr:PAS domain S-box protein [Candidatus Electrothrix sp. AR4]